VLENCKEERREYNHVSPVLVTNSCQHVTLTILATAQKNRELKKEGIEIHPLYF